MINRVELIGFAEDDGLVKVHGASHIQTFRIGTERRWKDRAGVWRVDVDWVRVAAWSKPWLVVRKMDFLRVEGRIQTREVRKMVGAEIVMVEETEVIASDIRHLNDPDASYLKEKRNG